MITYTKKVQSGRSMIEMLGVLAIVGVLSAGGIAGYSMAMQSYKTSALTEKVNLIAQQARILYNGQYTNNAAATATPVSTGPSMGEKLLKAGMITDLNNPFGGYLVVKGGEDTNTAFTVTTAANVPAEACIKLLRTNWGTTGVFTSIKAGDVEYCSDPTGSCTISPTTAKSATSSCTGGNKVMVWKFK